MVVGEGQGLESKGWEEKHWGGQLEKRGWEEPYPPHGPVTPTGYASQTLQEGRDINGEDKTQTWGEGVRRRGIRHPFILLPIPFPPFMPHKPFLSCHTPLASHSWAGLGWALPLACWHFLEPESRDRESPKCCT